MKNIKEFEMFGSVNEGKSNNLKIGFRLFIDYKLLKKQDFKDMYDEAIEKDPMLMQKLKNIWDEANLEGTIDSEKFMDASSNKYMKPKFSSLFIYSENLGEPTVYIISAAADLSKLIGEPDNM